MNLGDGEKADQQQVKKQTPPAIRMFHHFIRLFTLFLVIFIAPTHAATLTSGNPLADNVAVGGYDQHQITLTGTQDDRTMRIQLVPSLATDAVWLYISNVSNPSDVHNQISLTVDTTLYVEISHFSHIYI